MRLPLTIAYNISDKKVGCVLIQTALAASIPPNYISLHFDNECWELNPTKCKVYIINNKEEFDNLIIITNKQ